MSAGQSRFPRRLGKIHTFQDNSIELPGGDTSQEGDARYTFRFNSPTCIEVFADTGNLDNRANRSFIAHMYWNGAPTDRVALLFNGLDETIHQFDSVDDVFRFYNQLGEHLAQHDIVTILLPTPYHMNRVLTYHDARKEEEKRRKLGNAYVDFTIPTNALMKHNYNVYRNHLQGFKETIALCRCLYPEGADQAFTQLKFDKCPVSELARLLFQQALAPGRPVQLFLLGYSLGGLRALTEYVRDRFAARLERRAPLFAGCVAINSGGGLQALPNPPWVERKTWREMIDDLLCQRLLSRPGNRLLGIPSRERPEAERHFTFLDDIFLGQGASVNELSRDDAHRILFVLGGGDDLVPLESLQRFQPPGGVNILHVAGMGHLFPYDQTWDRMKKVVFDVVRMFIVNKSALASEAATSRWCEFLALLDHELKMLPYTSDMRDPSVFDQAVEILQRAAAAGQKPAETVLGRTRVDCILRSFKNNKISRDVIDLRFTEYAQELVNRLRLLVQRQVWHPAAYPRTRRALLLGSFLTAGNAALQDAWQNLKLQGCDRIGDRLLKGGIITSELLERAVDDQQREFERVRTAMAENFSTRFDQAGKVLPTARLP
jgi:hypothetical protein